MSNEILYARVVPFHQVEIGHPFRLETGGTIYQKITKTLGRDKDGDVISIGSRKHVIEYVDEPQGSSVETPWQEIEDNHTTQFTDRQRDDLIGEIVARAQRQYGADRINASILTRGLLCAHRAKPIRLIDLLNTCNHDFPSDVVQGIYRHYDPSTDTMRNGWTAQHSEPHAKSIWEVLFG